jgi:hypothetical protein
MMHWAWLLALSGCLGKSRFDEKYAEEICLLYSECEVLDLEGYSTTRTCRQDLGQYTDQCGEYDSSTAKSCIQAVRSSSCEDIYRRGLPSVCNDVCIED